MPPSNLNFTRANLQLNLLELGEQDERPELAVYLLDRALKPLHIAEVGEKGEFRLPEEEFQHATRVAIGPRVEDRADLDPKTLLQYRPAEFAKQIAERPVIDSPHQGVQ